MNTLEQIKSKYGCTNETTYPFRINALNRELLANLFAELGYNTGCEIGVRKGTNALHLFKTIPNLKMYLVDPYTEYESASTTEEKHQHCFKKAQKRLKKYDATFMKTFSIDAVKDIAEESLDFVHIDGNHDAEFVAQDLAEWSKRVKTGGIVSGHDYRTDKVGMVKDAVDAHILTNNISCWFICDEHTYFWVK